MWFTVSTNTSYPGSNQEPDHHYVGIGILAAYGSILPLYVFILSVGYRRWKNPRSSFSLAQSHTDVLAYNSVFMDLFGILGTCIYVAYIYTTHYPFFKSAIIIFKIIDDGPVLFHVLTCLERYLAVLHPVLYLSLKTRAAVRTRNISLCFTWLLCITTGIGLFHVDDKVSGSFSLSVGLVSQGLVSFCCFSVLSSLLRPKPGDVTRIGADQSKKRAFHIMVVIMLALWMRFFVGLIQNLVEVSSLPDNIGYMVSFYVVIFKVPSSLVLPLLFLQRNGNLSWCRRSVGS